MYSQKTIQNLKPNWYMDLSTKDKKKLQEELIERRKEMYNNKPDPVKRGSILIAKENIESKSRRVVGGYSLSKGSKYMAKGYFATLITTIYDSNWNEFVTLKNDNGYTVKVNLRKFQTT